MLDRRVRRLGDVEQSFRQHLHRRGPGTIPGAHRRFEPQPSSACGGDHGPWREILQCRRRPEGICRRRQGARTDDGPAIRRGFRGAAGVASGLYCRDQRLRHGRGPGMRPGLRHANLRGTGADGVARSLCRFASLRLRHADLAVAGGRRLGQAHDIDQRTGQCRDRAAHRPGRTGRGARPGLERGTGAGQAGLDLESQRRDFQQDLDTPGAARHAAQRCAGDGARALRRSVRRRQSARRRECLFGKAQTRLAECVIRCQVINRIAFITLDRPAALNALNLDMIVQLRTALCEFAVDPDVYAVLIRGAGEKAFCAGGDIRAIYEAAKNAHGPQLIFFETEYPLDYLLYSYPKPYIALIDGIVMGGGMGISQGSRLRIVGDRTRMAMPEVAIGFFPDVGAGYFLSRLAGALGPYLALTGVQLRAGDALYTGLADLYLPPASLLELESELGALTWDFDRSQDPRAPQVARAAQDARAAVEGVIHRLAGAAPPAPLAALRPAIDEHFAAAKGAAGLEALG